MRFTRVLLDRFDTCIANFSAHLVAQNLMKSGFMPGKVHLENCGVVVGDDLALTLM